MIVVYSANYGRYEEPKAQPHLGPDVRQILYTDDPSMIAPGWETRVYPLEHIRTPMLRAKWWKMHPHLVEPSAEIAVWFDSSLTALNPNCLEPLLALLGDADAVLCRHPWRDCIYDEADASVGLPKYADVDIRAQVALYRSFGHPEHWGLFESGMSVRRLTPAVRELGERWWRHNDTLSHQDQISLPFVVRQMGDALRWRVHENWRDGFGIGNH